MVERRSDTAIGGADGDGRGSLGSGFVIEWVSGLAARVRDQRDYLTQLDAAIGDADHGINMDRGLAAALVKVGEMDTAPPGAILDQVGSTLMFSVGGAAGPLYGSGFRGAGKALGEHQRFGAEELLSALRAGLEAIQALGAATEGDKTIVDSYAPAVAAFERCLRAGDELPVAAASARKAAEEGMRSTIPMQARKGRASYLGPRSVGHQDPGATSAAMVFSALEQAVGSVDGADGGPA